MNTYLRIYGISLIVAFLCLSSFSQLVFAKSSIALGSRNDVPADEVNADSNIANLITSYSSIAGYSTFNWYGALTTANNIYTAAAGNGHLYSISFYIGHGGSTYVWNWAGWIWYLEQQWLITDDSGGWVYDKDIFPNTVCQNCKFVLLWSCHQGETIGETHWSGTPFGMPYAWLHTTSLSSDGYASPDGGAFTFMGFDGVGPFLLDDGLGATDAGYNFLCNFYYASLYQGYYYSLNGALDYAAQVVWGTNFANCILRTGFTIDSESGRMKVFGNGNNHISSYAGGGGGCPLLYSFDGSEYTYEGLLDIHDPTGADVIRDVTLTAIPEPVNNAYLLRLVEHPLTHSYIDCVKLFAITADGTTIELPLISAIHDEYGNILPKLLRSDDIKTDISANHAINLKFRALPPNIKAVGFVFQIEGNNPFYKV